MEESGFEICNGVFNADECNLLINRINRSTNKSAPGIRNLMSNRAVRTIANDRRLSAFAGSFFGRQVVPFKATLFSKTGKANWLVAWHQDTALPVERVPDREGWGPSSVKNGVAFVHAPTEALSKILALRIHLDASTESNGPLRVIPGSHKKRLIDDKEFYEWMRRKAVTCCVGKGGVIAMSPLLIHASSKCLRDEPRRVLHIEYAAFLEIVPGIKLAIA